MSAQYNTAYSVQKLLMFSCNKSPATYFTQTHFLNAGMGSQRLPT